MICLVSVNPSTPHRVIYRFSEDDLGAEVHLDEKWAPTVYLGIALEAALFDERAFGNDISLG